MDEITRPRDACSHEYAACNNNRTTQKRCGPDLSCDVMGVEVEATDVLVNLGKGVKTLNGHLGCLHHLAVQALRPPWNVLDGGCLQQEEDLNTVMLTEHCLDKCTACYCPMTQHARCRSVSSLLPMATVCMVSDQVRSHRVRKLHGVGRHVHECKMQHIRGWVLT